MSRGKKRGKRVKGAKRSVGKSKRNIKVRNKVSSLGEKKSKVRGIVRNMLVKFEELDVIRRKTGEESFTSISPEKAKKMLEEIKVPSIEVIKDESKK